MLHPSPVILQERSTSCANICHFTIVISFANEQLTRQLQRKNTINKIKILHRNKMRHMEFSKHASTMWANLRAGLGRYNRQAAERRQQTSNNMLQGFLPGDRFLNLTVIDGSVLNWRHSTASLVLVRTWFTTAVPAVRTSYDRRRAS